VTPAQWARALAAAERAIVVDTGRLTPANAVASVWLSALRAECEAIDAETAAPDPVADVSNRVTEVALLRDVAAQPLGHPDYVATTRVLSLCITCDRPVVLRSEDRWTHVTRLAGTHAVTPSARRYRKVGPGAVRREDQPT
jgi:hypothetical protein